MPYNYIGDLYKREIVKKLQDMGFDVKSVNALNKIMEKWDYLSIMVMFGPQLMQVLSFQCGVKIY